MTRQKPKHKSLSNSLSITQKSHHVKVSDFTLAFVGETTGAKIYTIKGTNLYCSEKIRQQLLDGEISIAALRGKS